MLGKKDELEMRTEGKMWLHDAAKLVFLKVWLLAEEGKDGRSVLRLSMRMVTKCTRVPAGISLCSQTHAGADVGAVTLTSFL